MTAPAFEPPGPGLWTLDTGHFPRPVTRFTEEVFPEPVRQGFADATGRYGLLLDFVQWAFVHGWAYLCPRPVPAVQDWSGPSRESWDDAVRSSPELARRLATSTTVFERKPWRQELAVWDRQLKPALTDAHRRLQAVQPARLDGDALLTHVDHCRHNLRRSLRHHHRFNVTPVVPLGDLLAHAEGWTGTSAGQLLALLPRGGAMAGGARGQLAAVAEAVRQDATAAAVLAETGAPAGAVLASLRSLPTAAGRATAEYLELVGHWSTGSSTDVADACHSEMPDLLVAAIRAEVSGEGKAPDDGGAERAAEVRAAVPRPSRRLFDELLAEAGSVHRLRDERAVYCEVWANGLARRALLAAGDRLADQGRLDRPDHLLEAGAAEVRALMTGRGGPSASELAGRRRYRDEASPDSPPPQLGGPGRPPVPTAWLPEGAARTERAFRTYLAAMSGGSEDDDGDGAMVRGMGASGGVYEGTARVVRSPSELGRVREGDVLVAEATSPALDVALTLVGAIVTEQGGLLSHAAIVARELGVPAVVACPGATRRIPDGVRVRVDGSSGEAVVLPS